MPLASWGSRIQCNCLHIFQNWAVLIQKFLFHILMKHDIDQVLNPSALSVKSLIELW